MNHDSISITYENERNPTIVITDDDGVPHGYCVNLADGSLRKVCLCYAHTPSDCVCGYGWGDENDDYYDDDSWDE